MKSFAIALMCLSAQAIHFKSINLSEDSATNLDDDLDSLMDKYNGNKSPTLAVKPVDKPKSDKVNAGQVQDMEYKILTTGVLAEKSDKAD